MWRASKYLLILFLFLISAPVPAGAEMMAGTVLTVDREQGTFVLRTDTRQEVEVHTDISPLPGRMMSGKRVRIWGVYDPDSQSFTATDIRGPGKNRQHDPTGVRARIGNGKYCRQTPTGHCPDNKNHRRHRRLSPERGPDNDDEDGAGGSR